MNRPDYCPLANEPCQSLCEAPCGKMKPMTQQQAADIFKAWRSGPLWLHMVRETERHHGIGPAA